MHQGYGYLKDAERLNAQLDNYAENLHYQELFIDLVCVLPSQARCFGDCHLLIVAGDRVQRVFTVLSLASAREV